jgi:Na+-translocating ferredoxin:NAD+ oxidoreductase subunit B
MQSLNQPNCFSWVWINTSSCDGCSRCMDICPNKVISLRDLSNAEIAELPFKGKVKVLFKGRKKAYVQNINACISCRLCEKNCHESAIQVSDKKTKGINFFE